MLHDDVATASPPKPSCLLTLTLTFTFSILAGLFDPEQTGGAVVHGTQLGMQTACGIGLRIMVLILWRDNLLGHGHGNEHEHEHEVILFTSVNQPMVNYECTVHFVTGCPYNSSVTEVYICREHLLRKTV